MPQPYYRSRGRDRALQHIQEARELSRLLGGTDHDVKAYFFSMRESERQALFAEYGTRYGNLAREYAEQTWPRWRSGQVTMSGVVSSRLFGLLPARMPLSAKYKLTEGLWLHLGPSSKKDLRVGLDATPEAVIAAVQSHVDDVVVAYQIPESMEKRFAWLAAGDVQTKQQLLNHLRENEKSLVVEAVRLQLPIMFEHYTNPASVNTHRFDYTVKTGKHELRLFIDRSATGVRLEDPVSPRHFGVANSHFDWGGCSGLQL